MTERLYHRDAYLKTFDAEVIAHAGERGVVLDRTAFYPEAGGQLGDRGTLGGATVTDTQEDAAGRIVHALDGELPAIGARVTGELDWARRRQHMAQHTAQHLLSGTLLDRARAATASARLGDSALTIDVARDRVPDGELAAAEDLANDLIDDDLAIRAWFPDAAELAQLKLRRDPKVAADIRVVAIGDYDFSPCGGTHCARTSQLGSVRIVGTERYKGMTRVTFVAGRRGRVEVFARDRVLRGVASALSCGPHEVGTIVERMQREAAGSADAMTALRGRIAAHVSESLLAAGTGAVIAQLDGDTELVRAVAAKIANAGRDALIAGPSEATGTHVVLFRASGGALDCGALWKRLAATHGGRGGGKAERAEGRTATPVADWAATMTELV